MISPQWLRQFQFLFQKKSITLAAQHAGISAQTLRTNLRRLEQELELPLFEQDAKTFTPAAYYLYQKAPELISEYSRLQPTPSASIQIGAPSICLPFIETLPSELWLEQSYRLRTVDTSALENALINGDIHLGVMLEQVRNLQLEVECLHYCRMVIVSGTSAQRHWEASPSIRPGKLSPRHQHKTWASSFKAGCIAESNHLDILMQFPQYHDCAVALPQCVAAPHIVAGELQEQSSPPEELEVCIYACYPKAFADSSPHQFWLKQLRQHLEQLHAHSS